MYYSILTQCLALNECPINVYRVIKWYKDSEFNGYFFPNFSLTENKQTKLNNLFISRNVRMGKDAEDATFSYSL